MTMRTPGHDEELVIGFLFGEGLVTEPPEVGPTACRGFLDAYPDTLAAEFAERFFGGWHLIDPPE